MLFWLSDLGTSDDSSLSDSVVQDEGKNHWLKQLYIGICSHKIKNFRRKVFRNWSLIMTWNLPILLDVICQLSCTGEANSSSLSFTNGSYTSPSVTPQPLPLTPRRSPNPSINSSMSLASSPADDLPPIQHSPWTESSLDQPYEKSKKSRSFSKTR